MKWVVVSKGDFYQQVARVPRFTNVLEAAMVFDNKRKAEGVVRILRNAFIKSEAVRFNDAKEKIHVD